jgi:hypothetical protein
MFPVFYTEAFIEERMASVEQEYGEIADNSGGEKRAYQKGYNCPAST